METVSELAKEIGRLTDDLISAAKADRDSKFAYLTEKYCPVKLGDQVESNQYVYRGKQMIAEKIKLVLGWNNAEFHVTGPVIKKNGTPSEGNRGLHVVVADIALVKGESLAV